jgi:hypothetical protein
VTSSLARLVAIWLWSAGPALAFDAVPLGGIVPDEVFFRAATCGAAPGQACQIAPVRWPARAVTVAMLPSTVESSLILRMLLSVTLDYAIAQINGAGSGLSLRRIAGPEADIRLTLTDVPEGGPVAAVPGVSAAGTMGVGYASLWWNEAQQITDASILISNQIAPGDIVSVVLEEVFQTTGPLFDIDGPAYEAVSILSQTSNATITIAGQDARLLRWLYPPQPLEAP